MPEIIMGDHFYVDLPSQQVEWIYYNPDAAAGGQYVINYFDRATFETALKQFETAEEIFDYIGSVSKQDLADKGTQFFHAIRNRLDTEKADTTGYGYMALDHMSLLFVARDLIDEYCQAEFDVPANYDDMRKIAIGYTTTEDSRHEIQVYANLVDYRIETYLDDQIATYRSFESLQDMVDYGLCNLDFDALVSIPEWVIADHEPPVARLDFLDSNGAVGDSVEYRTEEDFLKALKEELRYGVPLTIVLYRDKFGKTISRSFLEDLDTMPKELKVEDVPQLSKKPADRGEAR